MKLLSNITVKLGEIDVSVNRRDPAVRPQNRTRCDVHGGGIGVVIVSAARDLPGLRLMSRLRWAKTCSLVQR